MSIRDFGFRYIFRTFSPELINSFMEYHHHNGGLSRYVKIRHFYETLLGSTISDMEVMRLADEFSQIMRVELVNPINLISDCINFIKQSYKKYNFHIVSGSDQEELRFLCKSLVISDYFISIHGSPTPKIELVKLVLNQYHYQEEDCVLIGDSINDYEAAISNNVSFYGYNNPKLRSVSLKYIDKFDGYSNEI